MVRSRTNPLRTNTVIQNCVTVESKPNCILPSAQFRKLSKRQYQILALLKKHWCMDFPEICAYLKILNAKAVQPNWFFEKGMTEIEHKTFLNDMWFGPFSTVPKEENKNFARSVYRTMRELEKRDLIARLQHQKPATWAGIDWAEGKPLLVAGESGPFHQDNPLWNKAVWKSKSYVWCKEPELTPTQLRAKIGYFDRLERKGMGNYVWLKQVASKKGFLKDGKWIDQLEGSE